MNAIKQFFGIALIVGLLAAPRIAAQKVAVNDIFETSVTNLENYDNPFRDVTLNAVFTSPSGAQTSFWGFFDGDGSGGPSRLDVKNSWTPDNGGEKSGHVWKLRFMPSEAGEWTYTWSFSDGGKSGEGAFTAVEEGARPGVLKVDDQYPRRLRNDDGYFYPATIEMHYGEQLAYNINDYKHNYDTYIDLGCNMVGFLALPTWDFTTWQVNPVNNGGKSDPFITIWYQTKKHREGDASMYDTDRMLLFTWKRLEQHIGYLADKGVYVFPFQGFNIKPGRNAEIDPAQFPSEKYDWYIRYCMARLAPFYNMIWNNTWEHDNGLSKLLEGLDAYDPWRHLRMRVASSGNDRLDINDGDRSPEEVPATSSKPWIITENNDRTGLWGDAGGASGTARMNQDKVLDLSWRYIMRSAPVFILEVDYKGYRNPETDIAPPWDTYGASDGIAWYGLAHRFVRENTRYWRMSNDNSLVGGSDAHCLVEPGVQYLCYRKTDGDFTLDAQSGTYQVKWLHVKEGTIQTLKIEHAGGSLSLEQPANGFRTVYLTVDESVTARRPISSRMTFPRKVSKRSGFRYDLRGKIIPEKKASKGIVIQAIPREGLHKSVTLD